ncbi:protein kinase [Acaryochloris sp. IP29b_bin.148]|uniref:protein kinase domain-containing protein n=1 Tax=Acaryochloris sp. IP29b_bin.148 TaxID=2969218 RepID=UPI00260E09B9|nr:protein kinase [Acaryochloris sp. IP29b_bin.148]
MTSTASYCFNPACPQPADPENAHLEQCRHCQTPLVLAGRFRGIQKLGQSTSALTVEVQELGLPTTRVCKLFIGNHPKARELFAQEAFVLRKIHHPGIPQLVQDGYFLLRELGFLHNRPCLVMEKVAGQSLSQWIQEYPPISAQQAYDWLQQLSLILQKLHDQDFFHRDIKPSNILLTPEGQLVLIDFGATRQVTETYLGKVGVGQDITCIGTPGYMPPEQMEGNALPQSDVYALGRTIIHLLTGKHPLELPKDMDTGALLWQDLAPYTTPALTQLLDQLIAAAPGRRPPTVSVLIQQVEQSQLEDATPAPLSWGAKNGRQQPGRQLLNTPLKWIISMAAVLSMGGILTAFYWNPSPTPVNPESTQTNQQLNAVTCQNQACIGRDPIDNGCDQDMQTITSNTGNIRKSKNYLSAYRLELRYSQACAATWSKTEAPSGSTQYVEDRAGNQYGSAVIPVDEFTEHYADMGPGRDIEIRACVEPRNNPRTCTSFVKL